MFPKRIKQLIPLALLAGSLFAQDVQINEMVASNSNGLQDPDYSLYSDWIELYNTTGSSIDLSGYYLTDSDYDNVLGMLDTTKWAFPVGTTIPANGYLVVYADGMNTALHTNFKLSSMGEEVRLFTPSKNLMDSVFMPEQVADISYGRVSDGSWAYLEKPTPGSVNDESATSETLVKAPTFSEPELTSGSQSVTLSVEGSATIYYTTDGSEPTTNSAVYNGSINVSKPTVIKAIAVDSGKPASAVAAQSYIAGVDHDLTVVVLTPENYDSVTQAGGYDKIVINGKTLVDFYEKNGTKAFSQYADFESSGNSSESLPQLNGKLYAKEKYGSKFFNYKLYEEREFTEWRTIGLRNASQDFSRGHIRDALFSRIISTDNVVDMPYESYRPAVLYVHGKYEGIINIREDDDKYYAKHHYGQDMSDYQKERPEYSSPYDVTDPSQHDDYEQWINVRHLYFYYSLMAFSGQFESGGRIWRDSVLQTQFQFHMHDFDQAFMFEPDYIPYNPLGWVAIAMNSSSHEKEMLQFYAAQLNLLYDSTRTAEIFDEVTSEIRSEIPNHAEWNSKLSWSGDIFTSLAQWDSNIAEIRNTMVKRPQYLWENVKSSYGLSTVELTHSVEDTAQGTIAIHGVTSTENSETGDYFPNMPLRLKANPKPGYKFVRWEGISSSTEDSIVVTLTSNSSIKAIFEQGEETSVNSVTNKSAHLAIAGISSQAMKLSIPTAGKYDILIHGLNGRVLFRKSIQLKEGVSVVDLSSAHLAKGIAITSIRGKEHSITRKSVL